MKHWKDYSEARDEMLLKTNFNCAPWFVVNADDKDTTHIALIMHLLERMKYHHKDEKVVITSIRLGSSRNIRNYKR